MKTIEQKARAYDEALKKAKSKIKNDKDHVLYEDDVLEIFPELKESEDSENERIRKVLIGYLNQYKEQEECGVKTFYGIPTDDILTWLEQQGEQKPAKNIVETWKDMRLEVYQQASGNRHESNVSDDTTKMFSLNDIDEIVKKMSEQSPADKVEPKFKVGDWIVRELDNTCYQIKKCILNVTNNKYGYDLTNGGYISSQDANFYHLWTIQDAKDGDVLAAEDKIFLYNGNLDLRGRVCAYCGIYKTHDGLRFTECAIGNYFTYKEPHPATKEQRDTLEKAMADAGYTFDFEKKELKKIEQKTSPDVDIPFGAKDSDLQETTYFIPNGFHAEIDSDKVVIKRGEQKLWSEEYIATISRVISIVKWAAYSDHSHPILNDEGATELVERLNSIKDKIQHQTSWKPSKEQLDALEITKCLSLNKIVRDNAESLLNDLKKL